MEFRIPKYKEAADKLLNMVLEHNGNPRKNATYRGVWWRAIEKQYNNTITNALMMCFLGRMLFIEHEPVYLDMLREHYRWLFKQPGIYINSSDNNVFSDHLTDSCYWTYNQAMQLEGLAYLIIFDDERFIEEYLYNMVRLITGTIKYFKVSDKFILQDSIGSHVDANNCDIFPNFLFRHLIMAKRILGIKNGTWDTLVDRIPLLKIFMLDTFQAICKFESVVPGYRLDTDSSRIHHYGPITTFYVCYAAYELFSLQEVSLNGIYLDCKGILGVKFGKQVTKVLLTTYKSNVEKGVYEVNQTYELYQGRNDLNMLYEKGFCSPLNNHTVLGLAVTYQNSLVVNHTFAHIEMAGSKFAVLPDVNGLDVVGNCGVRILLKDSRKSYGQVEEYISRQANEKIMLTSEADGTVWLRFLD